ncbi:hypothetical protein [Kosakonia sp. MUSA4]|uniref:hypothetical protein n=1 Tax=Kosakonia sp. MUSA4 TaxID=2067958 RepID=UPI001ABF601C|nr:hypothetical protein [Kosakonia sp. MUSA4]
MFKWFKRFGRLCCGPKNKEAPAYFYYDIGTSFKCWFTDPGNNKFSSFYYYDTETSEFCRIRLELNRRTNRHDDGRAAVFYRNNRIVGFSSRDDLDVSPRAWHIQNTSSGSRLFYRNHLILESEPGPNAQHVYDCSDSSPFIHAGNPVIPLENAVLPPGVMMEHLLHLARVSTSWKRDLYLTAKDATPTQLAYKILAAVNIPLNDANVSNV